MMYLFNKYVFSAYTVSRDVLTTRNIEVNKIDMFLMFMSCMF